jgi:hypothetical protein
LDAIEVTDSSGRTIGGAYEGLHPDDDPGEVQRKGPRKVRLHRGRPGIRVRLSERIHVVPFEDVREVALYPEATSNWWLIGTGVGLTIDVFIVVAGVAIGNAFGPF